MKKIAVVTGASSGIGKEFFLSLCDKTKELDEIWVVARNQTALESLREHTSIPLRVFALDLSLNASMATLEEAFRAEMEQRERFIRQKGEMEKLIDFLAGNKARQQEYKDKLDRMERRGVIEEEIVW